METSQVIQEIVAYTNSWKKTKENILKLKKRGDSFCFFWLFYLKRWGKYRHFFNKKKPDFQVKLIFEQRE